MQCTHHSTKRAVRFFLIVLFVLLSVSFSAATNSGAIRDVSLSRPFFDPRLGQSVAVTMRLAMPGKLSVDVLDRDGFVVRRLISGEPVTAGVHRELWDGKADDSTILPNEAFSFRILLKGSGSTSTYDPYSGFVASVVGGSVPGYSRATGTVSYRLKQSARVHLQVGMGHREGKDRALKGVVLANLVDHEPRPAGSVIEAWNGYVGEGGFYLPADPRLFISVFATSLPENSVILSSNSTEKYADYARRHRPEDQLRPRALAAQTHLNHSGLSVFEDRSPAVIVKPLNASWLAGGKEWQPHGDLKMAVAMDEAQAPFFLTPETELQLFVDENRVSLKAGVANPAEATVSAADLPAGEHLVTVNWISGHGPVGVAAIKVLVSSDKVGGAQ